MNEQNIQLSQKNNDKQIQDTTQSNTSEPKFKWKKIDCFLNFFYVERHTSQMASLTFYVAFIVSGMCYFISKSDRLSSVDIIISLIYFSWTALTIMARFRHSQEYYKKFSFIKGKVITVKETQELITKKNVKFFIVLGCLILLSLIGLGIWILVLFLSTDNNFKLIFRVISYIVFTIIIISLFSYRKIKKIQNK